MHYKLTFIIDNNVDNQDIESTLKSIINNNEQFLKFIKIRKFFLFLLLRIAFLFHFYYLQNYIQSS